jgi:hypothetical protein
VRLLFGLPIYLFAWAGTPVYTERLRVLLMLARGLGMCGAVLLCSATEETVAAAGALLMLCAAPAAGAAYGLFHRDDVPQRGEDRAELQRHREAALQLQQAAAGGGWPAAGGDALPRCSYLAGAYLTRQQRTERKARNAQQLVNYALAPKGIRA